jgi:hypothetical protein
MTPTNCPVRSEACVLEGYLESIASILSAMSCIIEGMT